MMNLVDVSYVKIALKPNNRFVAIYAPTAPVDSWERVYRSDDRICPKCGAYINWDREELMHEDCEYKILTDLEMLAEIEEMGGSVTLA
jgi:hypothetical protein